MWSHHAIVCLLTKRFDKVETKSFRKRTCYVWVDFEKRCKCSSPLWVRTMWLRCPCVLRGNVWVWVLCVALWVSLSEKKQTANVTFAWQWQIDNSLFVFFQWIFVDVSVFLIPVCHFACVSLSFSLYVQVYVYSLVFSSAFCLCVCLCMPLHAPKHVCESIF